MIEIDYIRPRIISGSYRYCYQQWQVTNSAGEAEVALPRMSNNKEASQEWPLDYLVDCLTTQISLLLFRLTKVVL